MPSLNSLPLSLSEILEARGGPLRELEIWALLCQCAETLQDLIIKGEAVGDEAFRHIITPNSLMVRDNGTITLADVATDLSGSLYLAPELDSDKRQYVTDTAFEKMFVYSLGQTLQVASEFGLTENEVLSISYDLDSLLQAMSERNAAVRLGLMHILEACALQARQHPHKSPHTYTLSRLYRTVLSSSASSSFRDSSYGSGGSHQSTLSTITGRARRPRPHVRHRRENQKSRSRSRSRSHSPRRSREGQNYGMSSQLRSGSPLKANETGIKMMDDQTENKTSASSSQFLDTSMSSTGSDHYEYAARHHQTPPYAAAQSVQGLLGLRQGNPSYQKYIQLKDRQIRLRQARLGQAPSALDDVRSRLMTPTLLSNEMIDNISQNQSMVSLMSYTIGTYKPNLLTQLGSAAALNYAEPAETDSGSQMSLMLGGGDYSQALRAEEMPPAHLVPETIVALPQQIHHKLQQQQLQQQGNKQNAQSEPLLRQTQNLLSSRTADTQAENTTGPVKKQRESYGPQYVFWNIKPSIRIAVPPPDNLKNAAQLRTLTVVHLTGQRLEVLLDPSTTGQQLFDTVIPHLDIDDFFFFGLTYMSESEHFFLDAETKLHKVAPEGWREGPKDQAIHATFTLYVRIKFYPDSLTDFRHTNNYHILYLQLRRDVLEERVTCDLDTLVRLAGLAIQAEYGDYSQAIMENNIFIPEHYFPGKAVRRVGASAMADKALREHRSCAGIPEYKAEIEYIKHVRHLPEYGIQFHKLFKNKSNTDTYMWVGLSTHSLVLAEPETFGRRIVQEHPWNSILKISFNRRRFSIQPKTEVARGKPPKINFYTSSYRKGKYLLQFSTDQHRFEIKMRARPSNMETLSAGNLVVETADVAVGNDEVVETIVEGRIAPPAYVDASLQALPYDEEDEADTQFWEERAAAPSFDHPLQYKNPPPYQPPPMAKLLGGLHLLSEVDTVQLHASVSDLASADLDDHQLKMLLDMSSNSSSQDSALTSDKSEYEENSPHRSPMMPHKDFKFGRRIFEAVLEKEGPLGIGLTIIGGEATSSLDLGIFVKSVVAGGPAERDGRILPGDRLIAIGGISLEGKQHHEAVAMIRDGGSQIALLVSQIRPPGTIKKRNIHDEQAEFEKKLRNSILDYSANKSGHDAAISRRDFSGLDNLLRFDDFVNNIHSSSDSDNVHNSQMVYPQAPSSTLSSPSHPYSKSFIYPGDGIKSANTNSTPTRKTESNTHHTPHTAHTTMQQGPHDKDHSRSQFSVHPEKLNRNAWHQSGYGHSGKNAHTLQHLREEGEIYFDSTRPIPDWCSDDGTQNREEFSHGGLTKEDREHLQLLGDIAALEANDSSSDSDFDTAITKTLKGQNPRSKDGRVVNPASLAANHIPAELGTNLPDSSVTYEVILENYGNSMGIITNTRADTGFPKDGVYIKEILPGSAAAQGEILVSGDRILEVAGQNVETRDSNTVQAILNSAPDPVTVKVSRSLHKDAIVIGKSTLGNQGNASKTQGWDSPTHKAYLNGKDLPQSQSPNKTTGTFPSERHPPSLKDLPKGESISKLITSAPKEQTKPLDGDLQIVPPPPALALISQDSESNTQSDMDSDILDSSKSELAAIYGSALEGLSKDLDGASKLEHGKAANVKGKDIQDVGKYKAEGKANLDETNYYDATRDSISLNESREFNEQLLSLQSAMDKVAGNKTVSHSGDSSSTDSFVRPTKQRLAERQKSLFRQSRLDLEAERNMNGEHEDGVATLYGGEPDAAYPYDLRRAVAPSAALSGSTSEEASVATVRDTSNVFEDQASLSQQDTPEVLEVSLKKDGLGFGFTIAGGTSTGGCYVKQLICDPAIADGRLRPGDKLLKVNAQDVTFLSHVEAVMLLRKIPDVARLQLLRYPQSTGAPEKQFNYPQAETMRVDLRRPDKTTSLGLSLVEGHSGDGQKAIFVKKLMTGGVAHRNGLMEGDRIIQANGVSFIGISKSAALSVLRDAEEGVAFIITRSDEQSDLSSEVYDDDGSDFDDDTSSRISYVSPRNQDIDVPVIMSPEWLRELPPMVEPSGRGDEFVDQLLQSLSDLVQAGEHNEEFRNLHQRKEVGSSNVAKLPENKAKNRYRNVLPYDDNRVKLQNHTNDYINANHICMRVGDTELRYIACQGPVPESTFDFWAMVWQEHVNVIVMLTQVFEAGKVKCHTYWPQTKDSVMSDDKPFEITLIRSYELDDFTVVQVCIEQKETQLVRKVTQIQYTSWPDHGAPDTALPLLKLLQVVHLLEGGAPPVIHCSAGIGRTGTYIAIDTALATIEQGLELDLYDIVCNLRSQRHGMIQTTDQYLFCYTACMEALLALTD